MLRLLKKQIYFAFALILLISIFPFIVFANGPAMPISIDCRISSSPDNVAYVDLLIQIKSTDDGYVTYNFENGRKLGFSEQSQIVSYNQDGFSSFTFHFADSGTSSQENRDNEMLTMRLVPTYGQLNIIEEKYRNVKIALIDKDGNVIQVSDSVNINPPGRIGFFSGRITYDAAANTIDAPYYDSMFSMFIIPFRMLVSIGIETFIALLFVISPARKVFGINAATQIFLYIFMVLMSGFALSYFWIVLIGEVIVYLSEFFIFKHLYKNISVCRLALFVVTANTASLIVGLWLNSI